MGNYVYLDLTSARDLRTAGDVLTEFEAKNWLPLFWRIMFSPQDERINPHAPEDAIHTGRIFHTSRMSALARLHDAKGAFDAADQSTAELYLEWIEFISSSTAAECLLRGDALDMDPAGEGTPASEMGPNENQILDGLVWSEWHTGMLSGHLLKRSGDTWPPTEWAKSAGFERRGTTYRKWDRDPPIIAS